MNPLAKSLWLFVLVASVPTLSWAAAPTTAVPAAGAARAGGAVARGGAGGGGANRAANAQQNIALNRAFYATEMETLTQQIPLTDAQKPKVQDKIETMNKEIDTFLQNAPTQIAAARGRGARGAGRAGRAAAATNPAAAPNPAMLKLQDDLQTLINQHQVLINQDLTPEQRLQWESYKLSRTLDPRLAALSVTDDQRDKIRTLLTTTAQNLAALTDGKTYGTIQGQLFRKIVSEVLTDTQINRLFQGALPIPGPNAARGAQPAPATILP